MFRYNWTGWKWLAICWLICASVLFFLPGSALPKENWLDKIYFDKWVHFGLFAMLVFLWRFSFPSHSTFSNWAILLLALSYGFSVEFIQKFWIPGRSFDLTDVAADMTGAIAGLIFWLNRYRKK